MNVIVCANLPYYVTSPILIKLLKERLTISAITVMVQKEVAQRICAGAKNRNASSLSLAVNYYAEPELLFYVKSGGFMPAPKVDSAVIKLKVRTEPACKVDDEKLFFEVIRVTFSQRRKTIVNSLSNNFDISKETLLKFFDELKISPMCRPENLSLEDFAKISKKLEK